MNAESFSFDFKSSDAVPDWPALDAQWRLRYDAEALAAYERDLDGALHHQGDRLGFELWWRWARLSHFRAMQSASESDAAAATRHFEAGAIEAERASKVEPHRVEGHFWAGVCGVEAARGKGMLSAGRALKPATTHIERAANIDETYHFAAPLRVLARLTQLRPLILGGSVDRALDIYRRALQIAPHNSTTLIYYSQALLADQQKVLARTTLNRILNAPDDAEWRWEQARDRKIALELIAGLDSQR